MSHGAHMQVLLVLLSQLLLQHVKLLQHSLLPQLESSLNRFPVRPLFKPTHLHRARHIVGTMGCSSLALIWK